MIRRPFQWGCGPAMWYVVLIATCLHATSVHLDDFELPTIGDVYIVADEDSNHQVVVDYTDTAGGIVGGNREVQIDVDGLAEPLSAYGVVGGDPNFLNDPGMFQAFTQFSPGTQFTLRYDGTVAESMRVDLTDGGSNGAFVFAFHSTNGGDDGEMLDLTVTLRSFIGQTTTYEGLIANSTAAFDYEILFSEFDSTDASYFDDVASIEIAFNSDATPCVDFELDSISAVPEPSTYLMLGFGILTLFAHGCLRRKRWYREMIGC